MQAEYATDVLFHRQANFQPLYANIVRTAVHSVQADQVATFLGRKLTGAYRGEAGNDFSTRIQGTRIRHRMGAVGIKLYDKHGIMARVECTTNDVSFSKLTGWWNSVMGTKCGSSLRYARTSGSSAESVGDIRRFSTSPHAGGRFCSCTNGLWTLWETA